MEKVQLQTLRRQVELLPIGKKWKVSYCFLRILAFGNRMKYNVQSVSNLKVMKKILWIIIMPFEYNVTINKKSNDQYHNVG